MKITRFLPLFVLLLSLTLSACQKSEPVCKHEKTDTYYENRIDATVNADGSYDEVLKCRECDAEIKRTHVFVPKLECKTHTDANTDFLCDICGVRYVSSLHKHEYVCKLEEDRYAKVKPSCTEVGEYYCSCICGEYQHNSKSPMFKGTTLLPHEYTVCRAEEEYLVSEGNCTDAAVYYKSCRCGKVGTETFHGTAHDYVGGKCTRCNKSYTYEANGDYVYIGEYPQSIKSEDVTITETTDSRGYYLGSDGNYYEKKTAEICLKGESQLYPEFANGESLERGEYYFKVEPLRWRILKENNGNKMFLFCDSVIDVGDFHSVSTSWGGFSTNVYKESNVRIKLNGEFYEKAFAESQRTLILTTDVDNSMLSAGNTTTSYTTEKTQDKIFLLSYSEITSEEYGFSGDTERQLFASDYARASNLYFNEHSYGGNGFYWLRSPREDDPQVKCITSGGKHTTVSPSSDWYGIVPAMWIEIK